MLYAHTLDPETHIYHIPGEFTLATSDILELNGLSNMEGIPSGNLVHAGHRGSAVHKAMEADMLGKSVEAAIRAFEEEKKVKVYDEAMNRMEAWQRFRKLHQVELAGPMEQSRVYRHVGTEQLIGATVDMPCFIDGVLTCLDAKTCHKQYGEKAKQLKLKWLFQLQSYVEALDADVDFWKKLNLKPQEIQKAIIHLHPEAGKVRGSEAAGFEFHIFSEDAQYGWDSAIRMARCKLASGYKLRPATPIDTMELKFSKPGDGVQL